MATGVHRGAGGVAAVPVCMAVGYTMERVAVPSLRRAPRLAPLITAIGIIIPAARGADHLVSQQPVFPTTDPANHLSPGPAEQSATITNIQVATMPAVRGNDGGSVVLVHKTRMGVAMRHLPKPAGRRALMGININHVIFGDLHGRRGTGRDSPA